MAIEYIDKVDATLRRRKDLIYTRNNENTFITDRIFYDSKTNDISREQEEVLVDINKSNDFLPVFSYSSSDHNTQSPEYSPNAENFSLSPADTAARITFLDSKAELTEDKQLIAKNKDSIVEDEVIITVDPTEMVIMTTRHIDQKPQILESKSDLGEENGLQELKTKIEIQIPTKVDEEIIGYEGENLLQDQLKQRLEEQRLAREEEERRLEEQRLEREEQDLVKIYLQYKDFNLVICQNIAQNQRKKFLQEEYSKLNSFQKKLEFNKTQNI